MEKTLCDVNESLLNVTFDFKSSKVVFVLWEKVSILHVCLSLTWFLLICMWYIKFYLCILSTFFSGWGYCIGVSTTCTREFTFDFIEIQGELS